MNIKDLNKIIKIYYESPKTRHDLLCKELSIHKHLDYLSLEEITDLVEYIEKLTSECVGLAQDELYGQINENEIKREIENKSISKDSEFINIILEQARYFARR